MSDLNHATSQNVDFTAACHLDMKVIESLDASEVEPNELDELNPFVRSEVLALSLS